MNIQNRGQLNKKYKIYKICLRLYEGHYYAIRKESIKNKILLDRW